MKRSTTPALKQRNSMIKLTVPLKIVNQPKQTQKDGKKLYTQRSQCQSRPLVIQKREVTSKISPQTYGKKLYSYDKYLSEQTNPESYQDHSAIKTLKREAGLTGYLISKTWQNSPDILSSSINHPMKKLVTQWIIELSHYMKLRRETLYHAIWIFERCMQKITDLNAKNLQLLAITCLFISSKYEEIYPPHVIALIQKTINTYNKRQVVDLEQKILAALNFQLTAPNRYSFMNLATNSSRFLEDYDQGTNRAKVNGSTQPVQKRYNDFLNYALELTLLKSFSEGYSEKEIADAVVYLANKVMKKPQTLIDQSDWLYLSKIQQIAYEIIQIWKDNKNSIVSFIYDCDKWSFVGGLTMLF